MSGDNEDKAPQHPHTPEDGEDGEWEDIPEFNLARDGSGTSNHQRASSVASSTPGTPRVVARRRKPGKVVYVAAQPSPVRAAPLLRRPARTPQSPRIERRTSPVIDREQVQDALLQGGAETVRYMGGVLSHALRLLRWPFGVLLAIWMLGLIMARLSHTIKGFVRPVCYLPGLSSSALCRYPKVEYDAEGELVPQQADYPKLVQIQSSSFEQLLDSSVGGSGLSLEIKKAEMASQDLITLVKVSDLRGRDLLAESLLEFVEDAKKTGKGLQKLTSKINGAVDKIMAINDYALHTIESTQNEPKSVLRVIWPFIATPAQQTQDVVVQAFRDSMDVHAAEMRRLILELAISEANLERLDTHLVTLHELCTRENLTLSEARDDLLSELWTLLGGNRRRLRGMESNLELLRELGEYRKRAAAHVAAAKQTLLAMSEDMEDLRERVAAPDIVGDRIPVEVHMKSIQSGLERLREDRIKAREREEHLMNKILGVGSS
ncbi:hypothetical protein FKP32DRAFT_1674052 [Trametes sanguinea]|nr:hypothetical protein FKP32DRAFT_1674052 [Trametes sanguinea]